MANYTRTDIGSGYNSSSSINTELTKVETAIEQSLARDGGASNAMSADIDMNSNQILNLPDAVTSQEPATYGQLIGTTVGSTFTTADAKFIDTVALATADTSLVVGNVVILKDRASGVFDVVSTSGVTPNTFDVIISTADALISFVLRTNGTVNVKAFGATGDGTTDDTAAIQAAVDSGVDTLSLGGISDTYLCDRINYNAAILIIGNGATFKLRTADIIGHSVYADNVRFENVIFDGNDLNVFVGLVITRLTGDLGASDFAFIDCTFQNIIGSAVFDRDQYGLEILADGAQGRIEGCTFKNISNTNTVGVTNNGFNGGLFIVGGDSATANPSLGPDGIVVDNCTFENMWTDNIAGDWTLSATDAIRVASQQVLGAADGEVEYGLTFSNIYMRDIQKTGIKISGAKGVKISNVEIGGSRRAGDTIQMLAAIRLQACDNCLVTGVTMRGRTQFIFNISSTNVIIDGVQFKPFVGGAADGITGAAFNFQTVDGDNTKNINISNVEISLARQLAEFDLTAVTDIGYVFTDITFSNVMISHLETTTSDYSVHANRVDGLTLNNCQFIDKDDKLLELFQMVDSRRVNINNCYGEFRRQITHFVASILAAPLNCTDITIQNSKFVRPDTQQSDTVYDSLSLENSNGTSLTDIKVNNVEISVPSYDVTSSQKIIQCTLIKSVLSDIKMKIRDVGVANPPVAIDGTFTNCLIDGVNLVQDATKTGSVYAVTLDASSNDNAIYNVRSDGRGVLLTSGCNQNLASNIAAFHATPINPSSAINSNTNGTVHTFT